MSGESRDIKKICYQRLLGKSPTAQQILGERFDKSGQALRQNTKLQDTGQTTDEQPDDFGEVLEDASDYGIGGGVGDDEGDGRRRYYFDSGQVEIAAHMVYEIDPDGHQLRMVKYTDYTAERVRTLYPGQAVILTSSPRIEARSASEWAGSAFPLAGASGLDNPG